MLRMLYLAVSALVLTLYSALSPNDSYGVAEIVPVTSTTAVPVTYPINPLMIEDLLADSHHTESSIPVLAPIPKSVTRIVPSTTTTTTLPDGKCSEWYPQALEAGWEVDQLTKVGRIAWAESRCQHDIANKTYSYGLMQVEWSAHKGWLESEFGITDREALYDPVVNFEVSKWLFDYAEEHYGCGWQPWYMSGDWC